MPANQMMIDNFSHHYAFQPFSPHCKFRSDDRCVCLCPDDCPKVLSCWLPLFMSDMGEQPQTVYMAGLLLGCSKSTVRRLVAKGSLHPLYRLYRSMPLLFRLDEVIRFSVEEMGGKWGFRRGRHASGSHK